MITADQLKKIIPNNKEAAAWVDALNGVLPKYEINTKERIAGFIAQCAHESNQFTVLVENLNYSDTGLMKVFPKYFSTPQTALAYARKPQAIANRVYANRMSNGDELSGDGWSFRGRGLIQLTGRKNYTAASLDIYGDDTLVKFPDSITAYKAVAVETSAWFWKENQLNSFADVKDIGGMTKRINGGTTGLDDRTKYWNIALEVL